MVGLCIPPPAAASVLAGGPLTGNEPTGSPPARASQIRQPKYSCKAYEINAFGL
jgi:hypothetical protein